MRHNLADNGTCRTGSLSDSPHTILKNNLVATQEATYSTSVSINGDTESDPDVVTGQARCVYLSVWNRGADADNVFATVYWSPTTTLVSSQFAEPDRPLCGDASVSRWPRMVTKLSAVLNYPSEPPQPVICLCISRLNATSTYSTSASINSHTDMRTESLAG